MKEDILDDINNSQQDLLKATNAGRFRLVAAIALLILLVALVNKFISIYRITGLISPVIPGNVIRDIARQFIFTAVVYSIGGIAGGFLFFRKRYLWVIILVGVVLIGSRFIYWPFSEL